MLQDRKEVFDLISIAEEDQPSIIMKNTKASSFYSLCLWVACIIAACCMFLLNTNYSKQLILRPTSDYEFIHHVDQPDDTKKEMDEVLAMIKKWNKTKDAVYRKGRNNGDSPLKENRDQCSPQENIVFIKTHKTGSSTLTNILNRYADLRELSVVLPGMGQVRFSWPRKFHWSSVDLLRLDGQPANMLVNHARYNREQIEMVMADNVKYITILRNPVTQFESSFFYFEFDRILRLKNDSNPVRTFMEYPDEYLYNITLLVNQLPETINLIQSGMFYDLGYDFVDVETDDVIKESIDQLKKDFDLVMVMEYFDESLVLLKLRMCWEFDDILYIKQNQRSKRSHLTEDLKQRIKDWSHADVMLYQEFNKTFWEKIKSYNDVFWDELKEFKRLNEKFQQDCSPQLVTKKGFQISVDVSTYIMNPKVDRYNRYLCEKVLKTEVDYLQYFRKKFGIHYGYQKILVDEGIKVETKTNILQRRMARRLRPPARNQREVISPIKIF